MQASGDGPHRTFSRPFPLLVRPDVFPRQCPLKRFISTLARFMAGKREYCEPIEAQAEHVALQIASEVIPPRRHGADKRGRPKRREHDRRRGCHESARREAKRTRSAPLTRSSILPRFARANNPSALPPFPYTTRARDGAKFGEKGVDVRQADAKSLSTNTSFSPTLTLN